MLNTEEIRQAFAYEGRISRRLLLSYTGALAALPNLGLASARAFSPVFTKDPFSLGVASGDPDSQGVVLWTRLAPEPLQPFGGMPNEPVSVHWEISEKENMSAVVQQGTEIATPQLGHSVHVEVDGLKADRWYWYRFRCGDAESRIGRTRTCPASEVDKLTFAVTSCQNYEQGLFTAYERMQQDNPDLVVHLGDYIYEYRAGRTGKVREHYGEEIQSLNDYRARHAQYKSEPLLQAMHAQCPWLVTWDDHEFDNNCANEISEEGDVAVADFLVRRANAYQAYYEMMPLRRSSMPRGASMQLFRKVSYGNLADFLVLDTRQYRTDQPNNDRRSPLNFSAKHPDNSLLGRQQKNWLCGELIASDAQWNILAQQVMMGTVGTKSKDSDELLYSMDQWPGAVAERNQLLSYIRDRRVSNPVVLTGDIHSNWANELRADDLMDDQPVVASEFVCTSLSSGGNGSDKPDHYDELLANNQCIKFHNRQRGYILCTVDQEKWQSDYVVVDQVLKPGGNCSIRKSLIVESGDPRINDA